MLARPIVSGQPDNAIVWKNDNTEPFGNSVPNQDPSGLDNFEYNYGSEGQYRDKETGLIWNGYRVLDPELGRYDQSDPIGLEAELSTYAFVSGSPLNFIDPLGLSTELMPDPANMWDEGEGFSGALETLAWFMDVCKIPPIGPGKMIGTMGVLSKAGAVSRAARSAKGGLGPVLKGESGVARSIAAAEARGETVLGREITMKTAGGRTRPDILVRDAQSKLKFIESKCGPGACLNPNQAGRIPELRQSGGIPRGKNAANAGLTPGKPIGPTPVQVDYWP